MTAVDCRRWIRVVALIAAFLLAPTACRDSGSSSGAGPVPARQGLDTGGRMQISPQDRCPVCAMPVAEHERFSAAIAVTGGSAFYFCTPGCMLRAWLMPERYLNRTRSRLVQPVVRDYFTGDFIDGRRALWVSGSDVIGPMGPALIALGSDADLPVFRKRHGAGRVFRLSALRVDNWEEMTGKRPGY